MRSARRKKFREKRFRERTSAQKGQIFGLILRIAIPILVILLGFVFIRVTTRYWNGHDKVGFAYRMVSGDVGVTVLDPKLDEMTTLIIPGDTEVNVARNYGAMMIKNVWQLSQNEKLKGTLLPETVTQNFLFPIFLWSDLDLSNIWKFVLAPKDTNIPLGDRISMAIFSLKVPALGKSEIKLGQSQFLKKVRLSDGTVGHELSGAPSERLTVYFSDNDLSAGNLRVSIADSTGAFGISDKVGEIIEVLGGKVVNIDKRPSENFDCLVVGIDKSVVKKISNLFKCQIGQGSGDFDLEIRLGSNFTGHF